MSNTSSCLLLFVTSFCDSGSAMMTPFADLFLILILLFCFSYPFFYWQSGIYHLLSEFIFICLVSMDLDRVIPWIDVPDHAAIIRQVSRRAQKNACHVGQLAKGKVGKQHAHKKDMDVKKHADPLRNHGPERKGGIYSGA